MNIQDKALTIGKYGCLAFCYLYCIGIGDNTDNEMIKYVALAMDKGLLDKECTVLDAEKFLFNFSGRRFKVTKKSLTDISEITKATPVRYDFNGNSHWVVVENGEIAFNSLKNSNCVKYGKPTTARIMELA